MKLLYIFVLVLATVKGKFTGPTNQGGINIIKEFEGFHANYYTDSEGHILTGYGHNCRNYQSCRSPIFGKYSLPLTPETAEALLKDDLSSSLGSEFCVNHAISYHNLNGNQFSALVSFVQDMGCSTFRNSYLRNKINRGQIKAAEHEFGRYVHIMGGVRSGKLVKRRNAERKLFASTLPSVSATSFSSIRPKDVESMPIVMLKGPNDNCEPGYEKHRIVTSPGREEFVCVGEQHKIAWNISTRSWNWK